MGTPRKTADAPSAQPETAPAGPSGPSAPWLGKRTGFLIARAGWAAAALFKEALAPLGLRPGHWAVLNMLESAEPVSQHELAQAVNIDPSSMVALVDELERAELVERSREPNDRRRYSIRMTAKGRRTLGRARETVLGSQERLLAPLSAREREALHELLLKLLSAPDLPRGPHPPFGKP